jgi:hypothetical protein
MSVLVLSTVNTGGTVAFFAVTQRHRGDDCRDVVFLKPRDQVRHKPSISVAGRTSLDARFVVDARRTLEADDLIARGQDFRIESFAVVSIKFCC